MVNLDDEYCNNSKIIVTKVGRVLFTSSMTRRGPANEIWLWLTIFPEGYAQVIQFYVSYLCSNISKFSKFFSNSFLKVISKNETFPIFFFISKFKKCISLATDGHKMNVIISLFHQLFKNKFLKVCFIVSLLSDYQF